VVEDIEAHHGASIHSRKLFSVWPKLYFKYNYNEKCNWNTKYIL